MRTVRDQNATTPEQLLSSFQDIAPTQYDIPEDEPEDLTESSEIQPPDTPTHTSSPTFSPSKKPEIASGSTTTSIRRNHSDLVLQSLLSEEEFAEVLQDSPKYLRAVMEDDSTGISPKTRSKSSNHLVGNSKADNQEPIKVGAPIARSSGNALRGPLRTSATSKDSAMNLALHNLTQMSLKIQAMQQGK
jgi:hypothetical protein